MFQIKIKEIFQISAIPAKIIVGVANDYTYNGKLYCDSIEINVNGQLTGMFEKENVSLIIRDKSEMSFIDNSFIGKTFTSEKV